MNKPRLIKLVEFLRTIPDEQFNINDWQSSCGTVCCAGGWACHIPEFNVKGLRMCSSILADRPTFEGWYGFDAMASFFGLSNFMASQLFDGERYPEGKVTLRQVILRIQTAIDSPCP